MTSDIKEQRDRFLAFAFAGADLLVEVDAATHKIVFSAGAAKGLAGVESSSLNGQDFMDMIARRDRPLVASLKSRSKAGQRFGPVLVNMAVGSDVTDSEIEKRALISGLTMPGSANIFFTLSKPSLSMAKEASASRDDAQESLLSVEQFADAAIEMIASSDMIGAKLGMTFIDLPDSGNFKGRLGKDNWQIFRDSVSGVLRSYSADGKTAGMIDEGRFGVVHAQNVSTEAILKEVELAARASDPEGKGVAASAHNVEINDDGLSEHEMAKALVYTINSFAKDGNSFNIGSLKNGFEDFLDKNTQRISHFKTIINQQRFSLKFQPIVDFRQKKIGYHEVLVRFEGEASPFESIAFCEDVGLSPELDLAICGRVLNYLIFQNKDKNLRLSVNLSGVSVQNERFVAKLRNKLEPHLKTDIPKQLIFEITESSEIRDLMKVNKFIEALQDDGFKIALDDFGAGSASFQYLQKLHVDAVKIDGQYIANILKSKRDETMIRNLVRLCQDLDIEVVAERVETKDEAALLSTMGVDYGQGYYFAKPLDQPVASLPHIG